MIKTTATEEFMKRVAKAREDRFKSEIIATNWDKIAVLRLIEYQEGFNDNNIITTPSIKAKRYKEQAPPVIEEHVEDCRTEVTTITLPLLERIAQENIHISDLLQKVA